jgi:hypothetical protein
VGVDVGVSVDVGVGAAVGVDVGDAVGVTFGAGVGLGVDVAVGAGVSVGMDVGSGQRWVGVGLGVGVKVGLGVLVGLGILVPSNAVLGVGVPVSSATLLGPGVCARLSVSCTGVGGDGVGQGVGPTVSMGRAARQGCPDSTVVCWPANNGMVVSLDVTFTTPTITVTWVVPSASVAISNSVPRTATTAVAVSTWKREAVSLRRFTRLYMCPSHW